MRRIAMHRFQYIYGLTTDSSNTRTSLGEACSSSESLSRRVLVPCHRAPPTFLGWLLTPIPTRPCDLPVCARLYSCVWSCSVNVARCRVFSFLLSQGPLQQTHDRSSTANFHSLNVQTSKSKPWAYALMGHLIYEDSF